MLGTLKARWALILLAAVLSVGIAAPFALLNSKTEYTTSGQLYIPPIDAGARVSDTVKTAVIPLQLQSYIKADLRRDVLYRLAANSTQELLALSVEAARNPAFYRITARARDPELARKGVEAAAAAIIDRSNALSAAQVEVIKKEVDTRIAELQPDFAAAEADQVVKEVIVDRLRELVRRAQAAGASTDDLLKQLRTAQSDFSGAQLKGDTLSSRRKALQDLVQQATDTHIARLVASKLVTPPSTPTRAVQQRVILTLGLGGLAGLFAAIGAILLLDRRRWLGRPAGSAASPQLPTDTHVDSFPVTEQMAAADAFPVTDPTPSSETIPATETTGNPW